MNTTPVDSPKPAARRRTPLRALIVFLTGLAVAGALSVPAYAAAKSKSGKVTKEKTTKTEKKAATEDEGKEETNEADDEGDAKGEGKAKTGGEGKGDDAPPAEARSLQEIGQEIQEVGQQLGPVLFSSPETLGDEAARMKAAPKAVPLLKRMLTLMEEAAVADPGSAEQLAGQRYQLLAFLTLLDDEESTDKLKELAGSEDAAEQAGGRSAQVMADWLRASQDAEAQAKVMEELTKLGEEHGTDANVAGAAMFMAQVGPASPELGRQAYELANRLSNAKLFALEGKPLVIKGEQLGGGELTTEDWKGKVILVDFWATWCGPCLAELPRVKAVYAEYHDKGFEILGVSCDNAEEELAAFVRDNPDMPWPHLFDKANPGWHALATEYGIRGIPTMLLIDKNGIVRSVEARQNFEELIPQLLAEEGGAGDATDAPDAGDDEPADAGAKADKGKKKDAKAKDTKAKDATKASKGARKE